MGRLEEIKTELTSLHLEYTQRQNDIKRPAPLVSDLTIAEAEQRFPSTKLDRVARELLAEKMLLVEIEYRQAWNPRDPTLQTVREDIHKGPNKVALIERIEAPQRSDPWPPRPYPKNGGPGTSYPQGPFPPPAGDSVEELANSAKAELEATRKGDGKARAESRAKASIHQEFVR